MNLPPQWQAKGKSTFFGVRNTGQPVLGSMGMMRAIRFIATRRRRVLAPRLPNYIQGPPARLRKTEVTFYPWCTGCRIPVHACLFTGNLSLGRGLSGACRCRESNCENENKDRHKAFHGASPSIRVPAKLPSGFWLVLATSIFVRPLWSGQFAGLHWESPSCSV